ncbi:hypothetical protein ACH4MG_27520 [Streptomyces sp. NPDC017454]|uniref:hypothetical protein n=1 Tax=Streptomyces sp. NPDC017454 TaxID=3364997 RepID=UPI00379BFB90
MIADMGALPPVLSVPGLAAWLGVEKDTPPEVDTDALAAVAQLSTREAELLAELAAVRELNFELRTARDFADTEAAGYIDRTFLNRGTQ